MTFKTYITSSRHISTYIRQAGKVDDVPWETSSLAASADSFQAPEAVPSRRTATIELIIFLIKMDNALFI